MGLITEVNRMTDETITDTNDGGDAGGETPKTYSQADFDALNNEKSELQKERDKLKEHSTTLLNETKEAKRKAKETADKLALDAARQGSLEEVENTLREQFKGKEESIVENYTSQIDKLNNIVLGGAESTAVAKLASLFNDPKMGEFVLKNMTKAALDGEEVALTFTDPTGKRISNSIEGMSEWIKNDPMMLPYLKGIDSSGGLEGNGKPSPTASNGTPKTLEDCKGDRKLEAAFFNSQLKT